MGTHGSPPTRAQPSPTGGPDLPEDPPTCQWALPDLTCGLKDMKTTWSTRHDISAQIAFPVVTN
jgi:hypothetical protein